MKKLILSLIAVVAGTMSSYAQDDLIATLTHGSTLSTFTGATALSEAYTAADEGDVITLSPGVFNAVNIEKAITVRGAGMVGLESNGYVSTQLTGDLTINVPSGTSSVLTIEGIYALGKTFMNGDNLAPLNINKCRFEGRVESKGINMSVYSSVFASHLYANGKSKNTTLNCFNSVIAKAGSDGRYENSMGKIVATNCILNINTGKNPYGPYPKGSIFTNCIITQDVVNCPLDITCSAQNCLEIRYSGDPCMFNNIANSSNVTAEDTGTAAFAIVFKTLQSIGFDLAITETYELTETAAATYLGDDGTQVGIYGGSYPFDPTPTNPQIKKFTVSNSTDGDLLKVKINVE